IAAGFHAGMSWMAESSRLFRRKHPEAMLDGVRCVISLALPYMPPPYALADALSAKGKGIIAAYAFGEDYHEVMKKRLKRLARALDELLGPHDQRVFVDTAPVLESALAASGGLGWQGKHALNLHRDFGSWFLLGEIFTTADIPPDKPATAHCGSCTACIDACPTEAIVAPGMVDARRCISWLTIEHRGWIPRALRARLGNRIYGCDDCQLVCPWNRKAAPAPPADDLLKPRGENILPDLASLLALDDAAFRARFRKSPVKRTGRDAFVRNCCIAAGNSGDTRLIAPLLARLEDTSPLVRGHAAWALARLEGAQARPAIRRAMACEPNDEAREDMRVTLEEIKETS
ncbi:MAG: tRNA epoxyqueuosine(34) reductase QueG, partial [Mariprofundaceae bacterium]